MLEIATLHRQQLEERDQATACPLSDPTAYAPDDLGGLRRTRHLEASISAREHRSREGAEQILRCFTAGVLRDSASQLVTQKTRFLRDDLGR